MRISKLEFIGLLVLLGLALVLFLKTTLSSPISFGDEGYHTRMSQWIVEHKEYPVWIPVSGTNLIKDGFARPPLLYMVQGGFIFLLGYHEIIIKLLTPLMAALTSLSVFLLASKIFNRRVGIFASIMIIGIPSFITYSLLFYTDMILVFFMTLFVLTFLMAIKENSKKYLFLSGLFAGFTYVADNSGIILFFFVPIAWIYLMFTEKNRHKIVLFRELFIFAIAAMLVASPFILRNMFYYQTPSCSFKVPFLHGRCYVVDFHGKYSFEHRTTQGGTELGLLKFGLTNYANFAYGEWNPGLNGLFGIVSKIFTPVSAFLSQIIGLNLSSALVLIGLLGGIVLLANRIEKTGLLLLIFLALSLLIFYQGRYRAEDTSRHTLAWIPIIAIIGGVYWNEVSKYADRLYKYLGLFIMLLLVITAFNNILSKTATMSQIKNFSPSFFEACDWVKQNLPKDVRLMTFWSNRAVYSCQRDMGDALADIRLSNNPAYISDVAKQNGITHFFIQKFSISQDVTRESFSIDFVKTLENNPNYFEQIYENGPVLDQCLNNKVCDGNIIYKVIGAVA